MKKRKLLIADSNETFRESLVLALQDEFDVQIAQDGKTALALLNSFMPDVLVLDVVLAGVDGIHILECAAQKARRPKVLVATAVQSQYMFTKLTQLQVNYVLIKPCDLEILAERVREIAEEHKPMPVQDDAKRLATILLQLGVSPKHNGYHYLCTAVKCYMEDPQQALTKELYRAVGAVHGANWQQVERSIRAALESAWKRRDERVWRQWFPFGTLSALKRPTNGEVICRLAERLRLEQHRKIG